MAAVPSSQSELPGDPSRIAALCARAAASGGGPDAHDAIEELLYLHHDRFVGFARRKIGADFAGKLDAEDIVQEAYAAAFSTITKFRAEDDESFYRWVSKIIDQRFIDAVRALRRKKRDASREVHAGGPADGSAHFTLWQQLSAAELRPSQTVRRQDAIAAVAACIARLADDDRLVIERLYLRGESPATVAQDMGRSEDAVRRLGGRALERLEAIMGRASRYLSRG